MQRRDFLLGALAAPPNQNRLDQALALIDKKTSSGEVSEEKEAVTALTRSAVSDRCFAAYSRGSRSREFTQMSSHRHLSVTIFF